jgi:hypothetical protein
VKSGREIRWPEGEHPICEKNEKIVVLFSSGAVSGEWFGRGASLLNSHGDWATDSRTLFLAK